MKNLLILSFLLLPLFGNAQTVTIYGGSSSLQQESELIRVTAYKSSYNGTEKVIIKIKLTPKIYGNGYDISLDSYQSFYGWISGYGTAQKSDIRGFEYRIMINAVWHYFNLPNGY